MPRPVVKSRIKIAAKKGLMGGGRALLSGCKKVCVRDKQKLQKTINRSIHQLLTYLGPGEFWASNRSNAILSYVRYL